MLVALRLADPPALVEALGFALAGEIAEVGGVTLTFGGEPALAIDGVPGGDLDGVRLFDPPSRPAASTHPNGVVAVDHFVIVTPDFDRTAGVLETLGMPLRRIRDAGSFRQGFRRLGPAILELVEARRMPPGPARFWGLTFIADDLDALADQLGSERLRPIKDAVQPGRRIATLDRAAGLHTNVAFMDPER